MLSSLGISINTLFPDLPGPLRDALFATYSEIVRNFREHRWEPSELNGGKLCEIVYTILKGYINNSYPQSASKPKNIVDACRAFEKDYNQSIPRSIRIQIPRMIIALYEIRNNRGVGHVSGDINPNNMDATCVVSMSKWIIAELIRVLHNVDVKIAIALVNTITERIIPIVWEVDGKKRVLDISLSMKEKTLLVLYSSSGPVSENDIRQWVEHKDASNFRRDVLRPLHKIKQIEYNEPKKMITLSPMGIRFVEENILK